MGMEQPCCIKAQISSNLPRLAILWAQGKGKIKIGVATYLYGLGTMNIVSFQERTFDLTTRVWVRNLGILLGRC